MIKYTNREIIYICVFIFLILLMGYVSYVHVEKKEHFSTIAQQRYQNVNVAFSAMDTIMQTVRANPTINRAGYLQQFNVQLAAYTQNGGVDTPWIQESLAYLSNSSLPPPPVPAPAPVPVPAPISNIVTAATCKINGGVFVPASGDTPASCDCYVGYSGINCEIEPSAQCKSILADLSSGIVNLNKCPNSNKFFDMLRASSICQ